MRFKSSIRAGCLYALAVSLMVAGCSNKNDIPDNRILVNLWKQDTGDLERKAAASMIKRFNDSQSEYFVKSLAIPQVAYTDALTVAALSGELPCIVAVDQPKVPSFVWAEYLRPLDGFVSDETFETVSPTAIGTYKGRTYSVGQFDAALAIFSRRSYLESIDARIPTLDAPWSKQEFGTVLESLKDTGKFRHVLDLSTRDYGPDWWTYGYTPLLQSFGGNVVDLEKGTAEGVLNSPTAIEFATWFKGLLDAGYINLKEPDDRAFMEGRAAMAYTGNWWAVEYTKYAGDDLLILPPPDLGNGVVIGGGSWQWAISTDCRHEKAAKDFIEFIMTPEEVANQAEAAGMIPVTPEAAALTSKFHSEGEWRVFYNLMNRFAQPRPKSPSFTSISNAWTRSMRDIMSGKNIRDALDDGVDDINSALADKDSADRQAKTQAEPL